jgi:hypothetical protein
MAYTIVICYDGEKTEAEYFTGWKRHLGPAGVDVRPVFVKSGGNGLNAVEAALARKAVDDGYDEYWCVFDVDDTSISDLNDAIQKSAANGMSLAISCRSFEVWLACHWGKISTAAILTEKQAVKLVSAHHSSYTTKKKSVSFDDIIDLTDDAIKNAEWLETQNCSNPRTDVHKLVSKLNDKRKTS